MRVLGPDGKQIGILSKYEALKRARRNLDLVEIAPSATPPVAKIIDFNKFMYREENARKKRRKVQQIRDKRVKAWTIYDDNDLMVIVRRAELLGDGNKIKFVVNSQVGKSLTLNSVRRFWEKQ